MPSATYEVPALSLALLPASQRALAKDVAAYSMEWLPLPAAPAVNTAAQFVTDANTDFVALFASGFVTDTSNPPVVNFGLMATLQLKLAERTLSNIPVHWLNIVGSAAAPFPLPFPLFMPRATTLQGLLTSFQTTNMNARLTFHGYVLHSYGATLARGY